MWQLSKVSFLNFGSNTSAFPTGGFVTQICLRVNTTARLEETQFFTSKAAQAKVGGELQLVPERESMKKGYFGKPPLYSVGLDRGFTTLLPHKNCVVVHFIGSSPAVSLNKTCGPQLE